MTKTTIFVANHFMKRCLHFLLFLIFFTTQKTYAQPEIPLPKVPVMRQLFHSNIDEIQWKIAQSSSNGRDSFFAPTHDLETNKKINKALQLRVDNMQAIIELDTSLTQNDKFIWLKALESLLNDFYFGNSRGYIKGALLPELIWAFEDGFYHEKKHTSIAPVIAKCSLETVDIILKLPVFENNVGLKACQDYLLLKRCIQQPNNIMKLLRKSPDVFFADSLIKIAAHRNQEELYDYASGENELGQKIRACNDSLVQTICRIAVLNTGRMYFPFLDQLYHKKITLDSITKIIENDEAYYKLLVNTQTQYALNMIHGDTPLVHQVLTDKLRAKAIDYYINVINALHDEKSETERFKIIERLTPAELYYLSVLGEDVIYTSSYLGVYKRIFERMKQPKADKLLRLVHFDYYKKFIKIAADYNQLDDFLKRMEPSTADSIMRSFVNDLAAKSDLEDAVDVAGAFASITNPKIRKLITLQVEKNRMEDSTNHLTRSATIYRILHTIFLSMDTANKINLTTELGINPIFIMPISLLKDTSGRIIVQQFFFGDKDGRSVFKGFVNQFDEPQRWKITHKEEWIEVKSVKGIPITIYANKPLDTELDLDAQAQDHLRQYLDSANLSPTVVIHRGHSYFVKYTIDQLSSSAKVILLGSCGGYQSLNKVLTLCPLAHIISSKQVGTGEINEGMLEVILEQLRQGKDLVWPNLWKVFSAKFNDAKSRDRFNDYVPPHKNLGAIFIMAYEKALQTDN